MIEMVGNRPWDGWQPSLGWLVTMMGMVGDHPWDGGGPSLEWLVTIFGLGLTILGIVAEKSMVLHLVVIL